ncbi:uncharacterized protein LOC113562483 [Ooceraea biroi]|uniref:uncharacterized protein LOC113562483 n=1 Tax=Ooceraea biroi TaxID=2015173 RepID=UPI000F073F0D|nr:uncharacterized protein LOC113562483 [Ooceraea biroi]
MSSSPSTFYQELSKDILRSDYDQILSTSLNDRLSGLLLHTSHCGVHSSRTGKFAFDLEYLRHAFCNSSCTSANTTPYIVNLVCAIKCPELYLPTHTFTTKQQKEEQSTISSRNTKRGLE